jgi:hypothetical protein
METKTFRAAIERGLGSGPSDLTVEQIWARIQVRRNAEL